jgi:hypothetical protein
LIPDERETVDRITAEPEDGSGMDASGSPDRVEVLRRSTGREASPARISIGAPAGDTVTPSAVDCDTGSPAVSDGWSAARIEEALQRGNVIDGD